MQRSRYTSARVAMEYDHTGGLMRLALTHCNDRNVKLVPKITVAIFKRVCTAVRHNVKLSKRRAPFVERLFAYNQRMCVVIYVGEADLYRDTSPICKQGIY